VAITAPDDGEVFAGDVEIEGEYADDECLDSVTLYIDGHSVASYVPYQWDTTLADDGRHTITLRAVDCAGNWAEDSIQVEVDNTPPAPPITVAVDTPGLGGLMGDVELMGLAEDNAHLQMWVRGPGETAFSYDGVYGADACGRWSYTFAFTYAGQYEFKPVAKDRAGNLAWGEVFALDLETSVPLETVMIQQGADGYVGTVDTWMGEWEADANHGGHTDLVVRNHAERSSLLAFDLQSVLPYGVTVERATLGLYSLQSSNGHEMGMAFFDMSSAWSESESTYEQAAIAQDWAEPGANGEEDRHVLPMAGGWVAYEEAWLATNVTALVGHWAENDSSNHGALLKGTGDVSVEYRFASSEYPEACRRPVLYVIYSDSYAIELSF